MTELDGLYTYEYTIENADSSPTGINVLFLDVVDEQGVVEGSLLGFGQYEIDAPNGWTGEYFENSSPIEEVTFIQADGRNCGTPGVVPGSVETFSIQSEFGPGERSLFAGHLVQSCDHFFRHGPTPCSRSKCVTWVRRSGPASRNRQRHWFGYFSVCCR